jgi:hypothetical protein
VQLLQVVDMTTLTSPTVSGFVRLGAAATDIEVCKGAILAVSLMHEASHALPGTVRLFDITNGTI